MTRIVRSRVEMGSGRREMRITLQSMMRIARSRAAPGSELETRIVGSRGMAVGTRRGRAAG